MCDIPAHSQAGTIAARLGGSAKLIVNQLTPQQLTVGENYRGIQMDPVTYLLTLLQERFGPLQEESRLSAMMEMMHFKRKQGESTQTFLMRYDLMRQKAAVEGGYALNVETSCAILLSMLGPLSRERVQTLLQPTNYNLPRTEP